MPKTAPAPTTKPRPIRAVRRHRHHFHRPTHRQGCHPVQTPRYLGRYGANIHGFPALRRYRPARRSVPETPGSSAPSPRPAGGFILRQLTNPGPKNQTLLHTPIPQTNQTAPQAVRPPMTRAAPDQDHPGPPCLDHGSPIDLTRPQALPPGGRPSFFFSLSRPDASGPKNKTTNPKQKNQTVSAAGMPVALWRGREKTRTTRQSGDHLHCIRRDQAVIPKNPHFGPIPGGTNGGGVMYSMRAGRVACGAEAPRILISMALKHSALGRRDDHG